MIINALCEHYDILACDEMAGISPYGYAPLNYSFVAVLSSDGELCDVISYVANKGDKPKIDIAPKGFDIAGVTRLLVCGNAAYIFGLGNSGKNAFKIAKDLHLRLFENATSKEAVAAKLFFEQWEFKKADEQEVIYKHFKKDGTFPGGNIAFRLKDEMKHFHECDEIRQIWLNENSKRGSADNEYIAQCSITGEISNIARLHTPQLSGVMGAQATGTSLICFNKPSDESYNLSQSRNSCVSELVMFKYITVLQYLLKSSNNKLYIGDDTCVFWASSPNKVYEETALSLLLGVDKSDNESDKMEVDRISEERIKTILTDGAKGVHAIPDFDPDVNFYVLGLAPNAGRVSVRYFYRNSFTEFCEKVKRYYDETQICGKLDHIKIGSLLYSTINANSSDKKVTPLLGGAVMRSILSGSGYPKILLNQIIIRAKAEQQITQARAAAIKAYLIRNKKEEVSTMLNEQSTNPAYVLGRTFAILEMIQKNSVEGKLNATIKDKYFASACSNPALVFPTLLKLAQHHLAKMEGVFWEKKLGDCLGLLEGESFPKVQNVENQGSFILGYYQQTQKNYEKKEKDSDGSN